MAFKLATERRFKSKINVKMPLEIGGHSTFSFHAIFKMLKVTEINQIRDEKGDQQLLKDVLVGFEDVQTEEGQPQEFNADARDALIDEPLVAMALTEVYLKEALGGLGRQKN